MIIGADLVPTKTNFELFNIGNTETLFGKELTDRVKSADFTLFNLEVPLTDKVSPIKKNGPNLFAPTSTIKGLKAINSCFFTLANNHILDQGEQGLYSTIDILNKNGIAFAGVGRNLKEAAKPFLFEKDGIKIGVYCCAEHEFSIAGENSAGVNTFDPLESLDHVAGLKQKCDYVIVLYHGGREHYRYPSPNLQKVCRKIVEKGADLVVCQHSHCIGCQEKWHDGTIVYGQGNFLFDDSEEECWKTSLLIELEILNEKKEVNIQFVSLEKRGNTVRLSDNQTILDAFNQRSKEILEPRVIFEKYENLAEERKKQYLEGLTGKTRKNLLYRIINKLTHYQFSELLLKNKYGTEEKLVLQNYIDCEAHRELLLQCLKADEKTGN